MRELQPEVLVAAHKRGLLRVRAGELARAVGCSEHRIHVWLRGESVSAQLDAAIRRALGAPVEDAAA